MNRKHRGQALVEVALILPLLLAVFFAIIDAAFLIQGYITVNHAAREATRFAVAYQPVQGECYDYNEDGDPMNDGWPWCTSDPDESEADYHNRRVAMIKRIARDESRGLRITEVCMDATCIQDHADDPGMWGVRVWGFPSFEDTEEEDHPGLQGLPVRVQVVHNVQLVVYGAFIPQTDVPVMGVTEMVNEGIQVGWGNQPPPAFGAPPAPDGDPGDPGGNPVDPPPELVPTQLMLNFASAVNTLPDDTSHPVIATVSDDDGNVIQGVRVMIQTDAASFSDSDIIQEVEMNTLANGTATTAIHSVVPAVANIVAWADLDGDGTRDSGEPSDSAVKEWVGVSYNISLNFETATNMLPDEREHVVIAYVTAPGGERIAAAPVRFRLDAGSFHVSGTGEQFDIVNTNASGEAITAIYANRPLTATVEAWLDYNSNNAMDGDEPRDSAVKVWEASGPYLAVTNHNPEVLEVIAVDVMDHLSADNPYSLWWCPTSITSTNVIEQVAYPVNVDAATADLLGVDFEVPAGSAGLFRVESHRGDGGSDGCAETDTLVAYSADIQIRDVLPDLEIIDMQVLNEPDELVNGAPITLNLTLRNNTPSQVQTGPFDIDVYLDLEEAPPPTKLGDDKQWLDTLGPFETKVITASVIGESFGTNLMWAQVDTSLYVDEGSLGGEENNVYGPLEVELECGTFDPTLSDDFNGGLHAPWADAEVDRDSNDYDDGYHYVEGDRLHIVSHGDSIGNNEGDFYYIYQGVSGDFDARVRVIQGPTTTQDYAKTGLMARESTANDAPMAAISFIEREDIQSLYRSAPGTRGTAFSYDDADVPVWVRLVRRDNEYSYYWTEVAEPEKSDWSLAGTRTIDRDIGLLGLTNASYDDDRSSHVILDDFQVCANSGSAEIRPPGYKECTELIRVPGFEGNPETVYEYWHVGRQGSYDRGTAEFYRGSFSMRLHASLGVVPCTESNLEPYVYQTVEFPQEIQSFSTLVVNGHYFVGGSDLPCSYPDTPDAHDRFDFELKEWDGTTIYTETLTTGDGATGGWITLPVTPSDTLDLTPYSGQMMRLYWSGIHDGDFEGTFFYMDEMSAQLCTEWPIPEKIPGTAIVGGRATTQGEQSVTVILPGADVWAYGRGGGDVYQTQAIQDGTYHFYNLPPGEYVIYAEALVGGVPRYAMVTITLAADEEVHDLNLFLE